MRMIPAALIFSLSVSGCADKSESVSASYVSPLQYQQYSCRQLAEEGSRVGVRASQLGGVQDKKAGNDAVATGVALFIFWPALFFIEGNMEAKAELSRLKGEMDAIESASIQKNCSIEFQKTNP